LKQFPKILFGPPKLPRLQAIYEGARASGNPSAVTPAAETAGPGLDPAAASPRTSGDLVIPFGFIGGVIGLFVGYLMRPAVPFVGQLDFGTVISRGSNLAGLDRLLISVAEESFN